MIMSVMYYHMFDFETIGGLVSKDLDLFFLLNCKAHKVVVQVLNMIK